MCGIVGLWQTHDQPVERALLQRMTDTLRHRGPDGEGCHTDGPVGLGHRRLAIIDLAGGQQPMANEDGTVWITFNGEIYNYRDLADSLLQSGHVFRTRSDTETILHAYEEFGAACVRHLRGMFAFGIWDSRRRRLVLARDRLGIKPLVYQADTTGFRFASELKAILADARVARTLNPVALGAYLTHGYLPAPLSIFEGCAALPPAHVLEYDGQTVRTWRYWDLEEPEDTGLSPEAGRERLRQALRDAVSSHLVSDVPVGALLSGGIDSATVVALMREAAGPRVQTFSIGFEDADRSELPLARLVAERYETEHHEFVVRAADVQDALQHLMAFCDEPFADDSLVPTYCVARLARQHVKVCLSGDGGDELFGGYQRYRRTGEGARLHPLTPLGTRLPEPWRRWLGARTRRDAWLLPPGVQIPHARAAFRTAEQRALLDPALWREMAENLGCEPCAEAYHRGEHFSPFGQILYQDLMTSLPDDMLLKVDRASMACSLEVRVPLLDHPLVEAAMRLPAAWKVVRGQTKAFFRETVQEWLPPELVRAPKSGFGLPVGRWLRGPLWSQVRDTLLASDSLHRGLFRPEALRALCAGPGLPVPHQEKKLWTLWVFEEWARQYLS